MLMCGHIFAERRPRPPRLIGATLVLFSRPDPAASKPPKAQTSPPSGGSTQRNSPEQRPRLFRPFPQAKAKQDAEAAENT
ncbi:hypothetical protein F2P81_001577 [Scophthalmus maximus]|uniref:Uncharacterized protein n=1 Tax=Scophthalmus maximus TaxID=52904 RepID=A0A6A4TKN3_SCOMX|nr:hypothetical protein F2P81_001577 [Scophthalmus maximus]